MARTSWFRRPRLMRCVRFEFDCRLIHDQSDLMPIMIPAGVDQGRLLVALTSCADVGARLVTIGDMLRGGRTVPGTWWAETTIQGATVPVENQTGLVEALEALRQEF